ncbi:hypothetical protein NFI96_033257, partial [Prochilodus magdalenae]
DPCVYIYVRTLNIPEYGGVLRKKGFSRRTSTGTQTALVCWRAAFRSPCSVRGIESHRTMAHYLFSSMPRYCAYPECSTLDSKIRLSIFLIVGECGGLPALAWALRVLYAQHRSGGRISAFVVILLLNDMLELLLGPYIVAKLAEGDECWDTSRACQVVSSLWGMSRTCGFLLQQVVVLESTLSQRHPLCCAQVFFPSCFVLVYLFVCLCVFLCEWFSLAFLVPLSAFLVVVMVIMSWVVSFRAAVAAKIYGLEQPDLMVLDMAIFMMVLYSLWAIFWVEPVKLWVVWMMCACLMSLRVIFDPLLCVLVCKENLRVPSPQAHTVVST